LEGKKPETKPFSLAVYREKNKINEALTLLFSFDLSPRCGREGKEFPDRKRGKSKDV
jgi:hypothetical protein